METHKITISEALPILEKIANDLGMKLSNGDHFRICAEKCRKYLNERNKINSK